ncbi:ANKH [Branchiostoma lanceolatum]|uniref:ANKH protein n=1 Tax=Branchiostoma lanceolatum TaxID=7740 RepID=A0A8K0EWI9_BRALA|nr:ANKH [Branchiostoma lanceolatum]
MSAWYSSSGSNNVQTAVWAPLGKIPLSDGDVKPAALCEAELSASNLSTKRQVSEWCEPTPFGIDHPQAVPHPSPRRVDQPRTAPPHAVPSPANRGPPSPRRVDQPRTAPSPTSNLSAMGDYWRLAKFMVPLACTTIATDLGEQALNRGVAFSENVTASYGLAFSLTKFLGGSMQQTRHIGLILVQQPQDGRRAVALTAAMGLVVAVVHLLIALTPLGYLLIERAHQVDSVVGAGSRRAMLFLGAFPLLDGLVDSVVGAGSRRAMLLLGAFPLLDGLVDSVVGAGSRRAMLFLGAFPLLDGLVDSVVGAGSRRAMLFLGAFPLLDGLVDSVVGAGSRRAMLFLGAFPLLDGLVDSVVGAGSRRAMLFLGAFPLLDGLVDSVVGAGSRWALLFLGAFPLLDGLVDSVVGAGSRRAMLFLGAFPLLDGLAYVFIGMLLQYHHALVVGASSIADVCVQVVVSLALMETALQTDDPLLIPILALYAAMAVRLAVIVAGFLYKVRPKIRQALPLADKESFTVLRALKFWWPLALVTAVNRVSRPIVNLLVARDLAGSDAVEAVAVLTVTYPIGHLPYAWLNEMKSLAPAFRKSGQGRRVVPWRTLGKFSLICLLLVLTVSLVLFFVPGITFAIMTGWIQTSADIARLCRKPLQIFTFIAVPGENTFVSELAVSIRAYLTSWLMVQKRTWILTPSAVLRTVALVTALLVLPKLHIRGADMGIAALLTGFLVEASVVAVGFIIVRRRLVILTGSHGTAAQVSLLIGSHGTAAQVSLLIGSHGTAAQVSLLIGSHGTAAQVSLLIGSHGTAAQVSLLIGSHSTAAQVSLLIGSHSTAAQVSLLIGSHSTAAQVSLLIGSHGTAAQVSLLIGSHGTAAQVSLLIGSHGTAAQVSLLIGSHGTAAQVSLLIGSHGTAAQVSLLIGSHGTAAQVSLLIGSHGTAAQVSLLIGSHGTAAQVALLIGSHGTAAQVALLIEPANHEIEPDLRTERPQKRKAHLRRTTMTSFAPYWWKRKLPYSSTGTNLATRQ